MSKITVTTFGSRLNLCSIWSITNLSALEQVYGNKAIVVFNITHNQNV